MDICVFYVILPMYGGIGDGDGEQRKFTLVRYLDI